MFELYGECKPKCTHTYTQLDKRYHLPVRIANKQIIASGKAIRYRARDNAKSRRLCHSWSNAVGNEYETETRHNGSKETQHFLATYVVRINYGRKTEIKRTCEQKLNIKTAKPLINRKMKASTQVFHGQDLLTDCKVKSDINLKLQCKIVWIYCGKESTQVWANNSSAHWPV